MTEVTSLLATIDAQAETIRDQSVELEQLRRVVRICRERLADYETRPTMPAPSLTIPPDGSQTGAESAVGHGS